MTGSGRFTHRSAPRCRILHRGPALVSGRQL